MQINRTGIFLIGFFGIAGLALCVVPALLGADAETALIVASTGFIWFLVAMGLVWFALRSNRKAAHDDWIFKNGIKGTATVLDAGSNATVNDMPLMKLKLELDIPGVGVREVKRREVMPVFTANQMESGLVLPAYANPENPEEFILVW
ncbi:MAG: hypothetical protein QOE75_480 [Solirubrobacterales bacterium]|jgi:hypothetical protein|nr:hypothetical protein [Solirubrobacterales bacterium]